MISYKKCYLHIGFNQQYVCTYSTCEHKLICQECSKLHKTIHSEKFIFKFERLIQIHNLNKFTEIKKQLINNKMTFEENFKKKMETRSGVKSLQQAISQAQNQISGSILNKIKSQSQIIKQMIIKYQKQVQKTQLTQPENMIDVIVQQINSQWKIVEDCKKNTKSDIKTLNEWISRAQEDFTFFDEQLFIILQSIKQRKNEILKRYNQNFKIQQKIAHLDLKLSQIDRNDSFQKRYNLAKRMDWQNQRLSSHIQKLNKKMINHQTNLEKYERQIKQLMDKIHSLQIQIQQKTKKLHETQYNKNKQYLNIQEQQKLERKQLNQFLIKKGVIITTDPKQINLVGKNLKYEELIMICKNLPQLLQLNISQNKIKQEELGCIFQLKKLRSLKLNYLKLSPNFIKKIVGTLKQIQVFHLDSNNITDDQLNDITKLKLIELSLIDNDISDFGAMTIANNLPNLKKVYLSYNKITFKSMQNFTKFLYKLEVFHITRNFIKNKGAFEIAKNLKELTQLFLGGNQITKQGCLPLARNNHKLQRLSLGQNSISTDAISEIIMYLNDLVWLDVSYNKLAQLEIEKLHKIARTNENLILITEQN